MVCYSFVPISLERSFQYLSNKSMITLIQHHITHKTLHCCISSIFLISTSLIEDSLKWNLPLFLPTPLSPSIHLSLHWHQDSKMTIHFCLQLGKIPPHYLSSSKAESILNASLT